MAAKKTVRKSSKTSSKPAAAKKAAAAKPEPKARKVFTEAQVTAIAKARRNKTGWATIIEEHGSNGIVLRKQLAKFGFAANGEPLGEEAEINLKGAALAKRLVAERAQGTAWFKLAAATGLKESEVKAIVEEAGGEVSGRVYTKTEKPAKATTKKGASKGAKRRTNKAAKGSAADPS